MRTEFLIDHDEGESNLIDEIFQSVIGMVVDIELRSNIIGYPSANVYVLRIDSDGDVVVCDIDDQGMPQENITTAIPQAEIFRVLVRTGSFC